MNHIALVLGVDFQTIKQWVVNFHSQNNKYILFYTKWDAFFADNNSIIKKMGDTIGLAIGNTVGYYAGGPISYKETDVNPLVAFLLEGNYTQVSLSDTNKTPWVLKLDGNNIENDVIVLQKMLVSLGLLKMPINPNTNTYVEFGTYGSLTVAAVKKFQENNGLYPDGKVGKNTWNKLSLLWDEENAQPDRNSWSYKYLLQNNKFYTENPEVTLITPTAKTELERGESIKITAKGTNCHHLAVFINGEWKKTVFGDSNTNTINLEYDYVIPAVGIYNIEVKGRNIPGNSGVLVGSEIVEIEGTKEAFDLSFDNPDVWLTDQELITNLFKFKEYVRGKNQVVHQCLKKIIMDM